MPRICNHNDGLSHERSVQALLERAVRESPELKPIIKIPQLERIVSFGDVESQVWKFRSNLSKALKDPFFNDPEKVSEVKWKIEGLNGSTPDGFLKTDDGTVYPFECTWSFPSSMRLIKKKRKQTDPELFRDLVIRCDTLREEVGDFDSVGEGIIISRRIWVTPNILGYLRNACDIEVPSEKGLVFTDYLEKKTEILSRKDENDDFVLYRISLPGPLDFHINTLVCKNPLDSKN